MIITVQCFDSNCPSHHSDVRVYPDVTLKTLRSELGALLGAERNIDKFSFLKCVGRSLALVSAADYLLWCSTAACLSACRQSGQTMQTV